MILVGYKQFLKVCENITNLFMGAKDGYTFKFP